MNTLIFIIIFLAIFLILFNNGRIEGYSTKSSTRGSWGGYGWINPFYLYRTVYHTPYDYSSYDGYPYLFKPYAFHPRPRKTYRPKRIY